MAKVTAIFTAKLVVAIKVDFDSPHVFPFKGVRLRLSGRNVDGIFEWIVAIMATVHLPYVVPNGFDMDLAYSAVQRCGVICEIIHNTFYHNWW